MTTCASDQRECERETGHWDVEIVVDARVVVGAKFDDDAGSIADDLAACW